MSDAMHDEVLLVLRRPCNNPKSQRNPFAGRCSCRNTVHTNGTDSSCQRRHGRGPRSSPTAIVVSSASLLYQGDEGPARRHSYGNPLGGGEALMSDSGSTDCLERGGFLHR